MTDFKQIIEESILKTINVDDINEVKGFTEIPKDSSKGDFAFPCFRLAKVMKKSPQIIAEEIKEKIEIPEGIEKVEVIGGYINFYIKKEIIISEALKIVSELDNKKTLGEDETKKNIIVEYSSPNIAKPFHIGHLGTTVIGAALYNIYKYLGYNVIGINHLGDYGTQFGKMIEAYKRWGTEYDLDKNPIDDLLDMYVRINDLCKQDESVLDLCRENFKKLEDGDEYCTKIWEEFKTLSLKEFQKVYDLLGIKFDSWNGEAFYTDKMPEVIDILEKSGHLTISEGAKIIDLEDQGIKTPCMVVKSNGSTTYDTRDLAAVLYRARTYDFDKCLYVVACEQDLHFKQIFASAKYLGLDKKYLNGLEHVSYGMTRLKTGKMSTREGTLIKLEDLLNESIERAKKIIEEKNPSLENKEEIAKKVGLGAVIFNTLSTNRVKDKIFDWDEVLSFQGETGPYIQYTYVRTKSVLEKIGKLPNIEDVDITLLQDDASMNIVKLIYNFENVLKEVLEKSEPSILSKSLIDIAKAYSNFYNENKIICGDQKLQDARVYLTYMTGETLKKGAKFLGIEMPDKM